MRSTKEARELLSQEGWRLVEHRGHPGNFGNECLVMANDAIVLRFVLDRGFEHVDLACRPVAAEADWIPLEVAAFAAGFIDRDDVLKRCWDSWDFKLDTGEIEAQPLFENPVTEVLENAATYADILADRDRLTHARVTVAAITESVLDGVPQDLLDAD